MFTSIISDIEEVFKIIEKDKAEQHATLPHSTSSTYYIMKLCVKEEVNLACLTTSLQKLKSELVYELTLFLGNFFPSFQILLKLIFNNLYQPDLIEPLHIKERIHDHQRCCCNTQQYCHFCMSYLRSWFIL
jgi:hypothetical protein